MRNEPTRCAVFWLFAVVTLPACGDDAPLCEERPEDPRCQDAGDGDDGGADAGEDGGTDAGGVDAGPCGMECPMATPLCNETRGMCVECLTDMDCMGSASGPACNAAGECVECVADSDCTDLAAPECDSMTNTCVACTGDEACVGRTGTEVCAERGDNAGCCVECTATKRDACDMTPAGRNVCDASTNSCTSFEPGSAGLCGACVSDAQCEDGQLCVTAEFAPEMPPVVLPGRFCLWRQDAMVPDAPMGSCASNGQPFFREREDVTSVDGVVTDVCDFRVSSCEAFNKFSSAMCDGETEAGDTQCRFMSLDDSRCNEVGASGDFFCTLRCLSPFDCPRGVTCNMGRQECEL